jgi:6-phosphogluconolactonase (cycloisomerase 2 family)
MLTIDGDIRTGIFDPGGVHLFVNDLTRGRIFVYDVDQSDGSLTPVAHSPFTLPSGEQPAYMAIGGSGTSLFLYADLYSTDPFSTNGIAALSIGSSTGALTVVPGSPFQTTSDAPDYISVDPSGQFLYASVAENGLIDGYAINPTTGALDSVPGSPFSTAPTSSTIAIDPSGKFLYVTNYSNSTIYGFGLDSTTGTLSPLAGSPFPSVPAPEGLTMMNIP